MILAIARVLLLSSILGGFAVSASFAQTGMGTGGQTQGAGQGQAGGQQGGAGGGQIIPPPGTGKQRSEAKQKQSEGQQGEEGGQATYEKRKRGEGEKTGRREGGREETVMRGGHEGRHRKDARFRFYHGGFWYAEPWWTGAVVVNDRHVRWCRRHYPTYRASTNTFITPSGRRRVCVSPFS